MKYILILLFLASCSTSKIKSVEVIKEVQKDVIIVEKQVDKIEKEYNKLVEEQPTCLNQTIINDLVVVKNSVEHLKSSVSVSIYVTETEINSYKTEIKHIRIKKNIAWTITFLVLGGTSYFIIKRKLYD